MRKVSDPADPRRCKRTLPTEQCWYEAVEGYDYCEQHLGPVKPGNRVYQLVEARYRNRLAELAGHDEIKSLREEIALARMLIEERFRMIKSDTELLSAYTQINQYLLTVEKLVKSAHSLEQNLGALLEKPTVLRLGTQICDIIVSELQGIDNYEEIVDRITDRIIQTIASANNAPKTDE